MSDYHPTISGLEKASVLLQSLGVDQASKILEHLNEDDIERVLLSMSKVNNLTTEKTSMALDEAMQLTSSSGGDNGNLEFSRQLLSRAVGGRKGAEILGRISAHQQMSSFEMLHNADPEQVAILLQDELPQTIALVLSYLDAKVAADILTHMPNELQVEVTLRLAVMDRVSPQVVQIVEKGLKNKLSGLLRDADLRSTGGVPFLVKMLNQVDRGVQKTIFEAMGDNNADLVEEIRANMFTFDDLSKLDDRTLQRVTRDVNKSELALALKGANERIREVIFRNLSERARENLEEEIEILGPQLAKNVYAAQRKVVDTVRALEEAGEIVIAGGGDDSEIIV